MGGSIFFRGSREPLREMIGHNWLQGCLNWEGGGRRFACTQLRRLLVRERVRCGLWRGPGTGSDRAFSAELEGRERYLRGPTCHRPDTASRDTDLQSSGGAIVLGQAGLRRD